CVRPVGKEASPSRRSLERSAGPGRTLTLETLSLVRIEDFLAQPDGARRDLHELVVGDVGQSPLQGQPYGRDEKNRVVFVGCADIGELFAFQHIDLEII